MKQPLLEGEELYKLIPQRHPIVMVDTFFGATHESAETGLHIAEDGIFCHQGQLREPGLMEHVAQSAAAFAGFAPYMRGEAPKLGFIGEIKKFRVNRLPKAGEFIHTTLRVMGEAAGVTLMAAETKAGDDVVATCQMKIFIKND